MTCLGQESSMLSIYLIVLSAVVGQFSSGFKTVPGLGSIPGLGATPGLGSIPRLPGVLPGIGTNPFGSNDILNPVNAAKKFAATFMPTTIPLGLETFANVPAVPKNPPGRIPASSIEDVKKNFINAYMPFCPAEKIAGRDCICKQTYPHVEYIEDKGTRTLVVVAINAKYNQIVVSYRITDNIQNWIDNINLQFNDVAEMPRGVRVHRGIYSVFMGTYNRVQDSVNALLDNPQYKDHTLFITGFSLGAGIAQVSVPSWYNLLKSRREPRRIEVISYSNPRVGNRAFADYLESFNIPITRYTNQNDLVSHLPGRKQGYVHAGVEVYGSKVNGQYVLRQCSQEFDEDPTCVLGTFNTKSPFPHASPLGKFVPLPPYC
ncbi:hypothetical protein DSO57_1001326 [Entomophthora muscae]|uniref:Uncharacterized protein n=2 Tax=Entomophthora muscae TaxID=34485 RepID=A0ACC2U6Z0_9FUNG|nr:hypothetical protein DSO57_1001324 [Entomophthora muscae]KAJ9082797.1 hypothetical protein DSO57_1001326 [Entomophthora muscae]